LCLLGGGGLCSVIGPRLVDHKIAKLLLEQADSFLDRTEAVKTALSLGMPLHEIEGYLDFNLQGSEEYQVIIEFDIPLILEPLAEAGYVIRRGPEVLSIDMRDNIDTWLGQDDLISLPPDVSFKETESFKPYSWPGPADKENNRRRYRVEVADERTDELRSVILTPYADAGNEGAAFRTVFPLAKK